MMHIEEGYMRKTKNPQQMCPRKEKRVMPKPKKNKNKNKKKGKKERKRN